MVLIQINNEYDMFHQHESLAYKVLIFYITKKEKLKPQLQNTH